MQRWYEHKKRKERSNSFSEHLVSKRYICKILASTLHVDVSVGKSFFNLTLFHLCQTYSYIIKHVKYALLNILLHRIYLFIPNHVPIITCILFAASLVVKMELKMRFKVLNDNLVFIIWKESRIMNNNSRTAIIFGKFTLLISMLLQLKIIRIS